MVKAIETWKKLSSSEQFEEWKKWNSYSDDELKQLLSEILNSFLAENPNAKAYWGNVHGEYQLVVETKKPGIPEPYLGIPVRRAPGT